MTEQIYSPGLEGVIAGETAISTVTGGLQLSRLFDRRPGPQRHVRGSGLSAAVRRTARAPSSSTSSASGSRRRRKCRRPIIEALRQIPANASPMDVLRSACSMLAHWDPDVDDNSHEANVRKAERLLAQLPVVMAARHRLKQGKEPVAGRERPVAGVELLVHAVPRRSVARPRQGDGRVADPVCRARVQRLDVHGPRDRLDALRFALRHRRRDRRAQRPAARRGERKGDGRAARQSARRRTPRPGFATRWPARKRSWASATASTKTATRGPCT